MTVNPTDKFLVNRSGSSFHVEQKDLMAQLEDDDLLLVNRSSKSYKITGAEFKGSLSSPPSIQSVTLMEDDAPDGPAGQIETDVITSVDVPATATTFLGRTGSIGLGSWDVSNHDNPKPGSGSIPKWSDGANQYNGTVGEVPSSASANAYACHIYKLNTPAAVSFVKYTNVVTDAMWLVFHSADGNTWTLDKGATNASAEVGIPGAGDTRVAGSGAYLYWLVSRIETSAWEAYKDSASITNTIPKNYGVDQAVVLTDLVFASNKDLDIFKLEIPSIKATLPRLAQLVKLM